MKLITRLLTTSQLWSLSSWKSETTVSPAFRWVSTFTSIYYNLTVFSSVMCLSLSKYRCSFLFLFILYAPCIEKEISQFLWLDVSGIIYIHTHAVLTHECSPLISSCMTFKKSSSFLASQGTTASSKRTVISTRAWMMNMICFSGWEDIDRYMNIDS